MTELQVRGGGPRAAAAHDLDFAEARRQRAESADFEWSGFDGHTIKRCDAQWRAEGGRFICANVETGKSYVVTDASCTCPDWTYRGSKTDTACKHQISLRLRKLEAGL